MTRLILIIGVLLTTHSFENAPRKNALLVAEYEKNKEGSGDYTHLVSYNFTDGKLTSKDTIFSAPTNRGKNQGSYVRYDLGHNFVYKNRYVISGTGNVIDVQTKSLVMKDSDEFIEARGDSLIFYKNNSSTGTGYLVCDLKNRTYGFVKDKNFLNVKGIHSPNHQWGLEIDKSSLPYKIVRYNRENNKEVLVNDVGTGTLMSLRASTFPNVPICWVDNQNFVYATYHSSGKTMDSKMATVTIHGYNTETKSSRIIKTIDSVPPAFSTSDFATNPEGKIIFRCAKGQFAIDIAKKTASPYRMNSVDKEFAIENNINKEYGSIISFQNKEIGRVWCKYHTAKTTTGFIGVEYGDVGSNLGYPKGIRVWNNLTETWSNIEIPRLSGIVGWIEK